MTHWYKHFSYSTKTENMKVRIFVETEEKYANAQILQWKRFEYNTVIADITYTRWSLTNIPKLNRECDN